MPDRIKDATLDKLCGDLVKERDNWTCQRCGKGYVPGSRGLQWAHLITRARKKTCWNPLASVALCAGCHFYLDRMPEEKIAFAVARLGQGTYDLLRIRSQALGKVDREMIRLSLRAEARITEFDEAQRWKLTGEDERRQPSSQGAPSPGGAGETAPPRP